MKAFLYSIPNKIQSFSKKLDVKAALCGRSWEVFNDEGVKQLFIFNEDETILITNNGLVLNAKWKFVPQNCSILITTDEETLMFRPAFFNKDVFALQRDGVEQYLFLIDEAKKTSFQNLSLDALTSYIEKEIAEAPVDKEEKKKQLLIEKQKKEKENEELINALVLKEKKEQKKKQEKETKEKKERQERKQKEREMLLDYLTEHRYDIKSELAHKDKYGRIGLFLCVIVLAAICCSPVFIEDEHFLGWIFAVGMAFSILIAIPSLIMINVGPMDIAQRHFKNDLKYHSKEEVRKLYEEL